MPELDKLLRVIQSDDTLIITRLDRIVRSLIQGVQLLENLSERGIIVEVLNLGTIDNSPTGKLIRNIMLSFSEFEHDRLFNVLKRAKLLLAKILTSVMAVLKNSNANNSIIP